MRCSRENLLKSQPELSLQQASTLRCLEWGMRQLYCQAVKELVVVAEGKDVGQIVARCAATRKFQHRNSSYRCTWQDLTCEDLNPISQKTGLVNEIEDKLQDQFCLDCQKISSSKNCLSKFLKHSKSCKISLNL